MTSKNSKPGIAHLVHFEALALLVAYFFLSNFVFLHSVARQSIFLAYLIPFTFGSLVACLFLYLFSHRNFFEFIAHLEDEEKTKQDQLLNKYLRYGRWLTCFIVSIAGGSILLALVTRFLFSDVKNRYFVVILSTLISTLLTVSIAKGFLHLVF